MWPPLPTFMSGYLLISQLFSTPRP
jgi:hypothetical protein